MKAQDTASKDWTDMLRADVAASPGPSIVAGWQFLTVVASHDPDALPIRAVTDVDGPCVVYHPELFPRPMIESPTSAMIWLPLVIGHISQAVLYEATGSEDCVGNLRSNRWEEFRRHACRATSMSWPEIVHAARVDGIDKTAEYMTSSIFVEDGIQMSLACRAVGSPSLRLV